MDPKYAYDPMKKILAENISKVLIYQNQEKIIKKLNTGDVDAIELSVEQITDEFMIYGLRSGLIGQRPHAFRSAL